MRGILFDLDGTLLDTLEDLTTAVNVALERFGYPTRSKAQVRRFVGNGVRRLMERAVPAGVAGQAFEDCFETMRSYYAGHNAVATAPYPGIPALLRELKARGVPMALVSNKPDGPVAELAEVYFPGVFAVTVGDQPGMNRKPAPDMPLLALKKLGLDREDAVYIGDSEVDFHTARNAGVEVISVTWGFRDREELEKLGPDRLADTPEELLELLGGS